MRLAEFNSDEEIYVDANIFIHIILGNPKYLHSCKNFLERVEAGEVNAVISPLVLDEVCFKIIIETLKNKLGIGYGSEIIERIKKNPKLISETKPEIMTFLFIIENYIDLRNTGSGITRIKGHELHDRKLQTHKAINKKEFV